jgi:hypothetical protein
MALTALKVKDLTDKGFIGLFDDHRDLWQTKAQEAYDYTEKFVVAAGQPVRPDDVIDLLVPAIELSQEFRSFLDEKRLTQKYWRVNFGELVLDRLWTELMEEEDEDDEADGGRSN